MSVAGPSQDANHAPSGGMGAHLMSASGGMGVLP
jgi:hypothetical protein